MKTFPLHPASFAAGLAIAAAFVFLTSQTSAPTFPTQRVEVGPHPRDMVQIREGQPFTVPPGKILVVTAVGRNANGGRCVLRVNGNVEMNVDLQQAQQNAASGMLALPTCYTLLWGNMVEPDDQNPLDASGRAWGYLAER